MCSNQRGDGFGEQEQPQLVINAIREVVDAVRSGSWSPAH
jgi:hypothetical protein